MWVKIKSILSKCMPTLFYFIILSAIFFFLPLGLFLMVGMSTDAGANTYSIYILEDVLGLLFAFFMPFIMLAMFYGIPGLILFLFRKKINFSLLLYTLFVFLYSLPFGVMMLYAHGNTSLEYKVERQKEIKIEKGCIIEGTELYDICNRYLSTNDINTIKSLLELDSTVLSYDYRYITDYMDYIEFTDEKLAMKRIEGYYGVEYIDDTHITFNKSLLKLSKIINELRLKDDITVEKVHSKLEEFISGKANKSLDPYGVVDDLYRTIPLMVTFENIKLLNDASSVEGKSEYMQDLLLKTEIGFTLYRVKYYVEGKAYNYQYGDKVTIESDKLYLSYIDLLEELLEEDNLTVDYVRDRLISYSDKNGLKVKDRELNAMQVFYNPKTLAEIKLQNEKEY